MADLLTFYLPQYHPIPENDSWYGKGFTEWTNVAKAKPLFHGHYQPHVPADLGFYDLRLQETRREQAELAAKYGINAFIYWNYWFGGGRVLLEKPLWDVYHDKEISLPFCLAWANHSWEKKQWDKSGNNQMLMELKYLGVKDYTDYFYRYLPIFKDNRYYRVNGKLFFSIFKPLDSPEIKVFISTWRSLAEKEGLEGFYFVGKDMSYVNRAAILEAGFDAVFEDNTLEIHHNLSMPMKVSLFLARKLLKRPSVFQYKDAVKYMVSEEESKRLDTIPVIVPNWDHSPRSGSNAMILDDCKPHYFECLVKRTIEIVNAKPKGNQQIIIKSWNEWGEGNHLEPDLRYGKGYLEAIKRQMDLIR